MRALSMLILLAGCQPPDCGLTCDAETDILALDGANVYWSYGVEVKATDRSTKVTRTLASIPDELPTKMLVGGGVLLVRSETTAAASLWMVATGGAVRIAGPDVGVDLVADANNVYYTDMSAATLFKKSLNGGAVTLANGQAVGGLGVDATHLYWSNNFLEIRRVPLAGGAVETMATRPGNAIASRLFVDSGTVWWCEDDGLKKMSTSGGPVGSPNLECPTVMHAGEAFGSMSHDDRSFGGGTTWAEIWRAPSGGVRRIVSTIYTGTSSGAVTVPPMAVDDTGIYWADLVRTGDDTYARGQRGVRARIAYASR